MPSIAASAWFSVHEIGSYSVVYVSVYVNMNEFFLRVYLYREWVFLCNLLHAVRGLICQNAIAFKMTTECRVFFSFFLHIWHMCTHIQSLVAVYIYWLYLYVFLCYIFIGGMCWLLRFCCYVDIENHKKLLNE